MSDSIESVLFVCREVMVFKIPPRTSQLGYKADSWQDSLIWRGRLRIIEVSQLGGQGKSAVNLRLEDSETGDLFATCPYNDNQAVEPVIDSSRYFVLRVVSDTGSKAFLGLGFQERTDAFDFNVALQEWTRRQNSVAAEEAAADAPKQPPKDFTLKAGEMISINLGGQATSTRPKPASTNSGGSIPLLPPPPSGGTSVRRKV